MPALKTIQVNNLKKMNKEKNITWGGTAIKYCQKGKQRTSFWILPRMLNKINLPLVWIEVRLIVQMRLNTCSTCLTNIFQQTYFGTILQPLQITNIVKNSFSDILDKTNNFWNFKCVFLKLG